MTRSALGKLRVAAGFSSSEAAAARLGISRIHLAGIERGALSGSPELHARLAELYSVHLTEIEEAIRTMRRLLARKTVRKHSRFTKS